MSVTMDGTGEGDMTDMAEDDDLDFLDGEDDAPTQDVSAEPWIVAIIDDAADVHQATNLALSGFTFENRPVRLLRANSGAEGRTLFETHDDIALAIIDVVMESASAGLDLVDWIRSSHRNDLTRIVLRTGEPGYAPRTEVIINHEIDDYKEKTELDRTRLITTVVMGLRGYRQITTIERTRLSLRKLIDGLGQLYRDQAAVRPFAEAILAQLATLLRVEPEGVVCVQDGGPGSAAKAATDGVQILAAAGSMAAYTEKSVTVLPDTEVVALIQECLEAQEPRRSAVGTCFPLATPSGRRAAIYVAVALDEADTANHDLLRLFTVNASVGYENAALFEHVRTLAYTDQRTGLPSFAAFVELVNETLASGVALDRIAVFTVSPVRFTMIETALGEDRAADVLRRLGDRLRGAVPGCRIVALGHQDRFHMLVVSDGPLVVGRLSEAIQHGLEPPIDVDGLGLCLRVRTGVALAGAPTEEPMDAHLLARQATTALAELRYRGNGHHLVFQPEMAATTRQRLKLASLLTDRQKTVIALHYQPIIAAGTKKIVAAEALLRMTTDDGEELPTGSVIAAAEASGLIGDIGRWVIDRACADIATMGDRFRGRIHVNISILQLNTGNFQALLTELMERYGVVPNRLCLEVTESVFLDDDETVTSMLSWARDQGMTISLDDFGTGYSSLSYLRKLPVDGLKIDQSFIKDMEESADSQALVASIAAVAKALKKHVTAEGVETQWQARRVADLGVDTIQGWLYSKALPLDRFLDFASGDAP